MWYLYLDESGDLGFDFVNKHPSKFFTVTILATKGQVNNKAIIKAVKKTLARKLNPRGHRQRIVQELKGTSTKLEVKKYFYTLIKNIHFGLYSVTLNKKRVFQHLGEDKAHVYNFIARLVLDQLPLEKAGTRIYLYLDKSKGGAGIEDFNQYIETQLQGRLDPNVPLDLFHKDSREIKPLQAADIFSWGIFRKYEKRDTDWYEVYAKEKIVFETIYLPEKEK